MFAFVVFPFGNKHFIEFLQFLQNVTFSERCEAWNKWMKKPVNEKAEKWGKRRNEGRCGENVKTWRVHCLLHSPPLLSNCDWKQKGREKVSCGIIKSKIYGPINKNVVVDASIKSPRSDKRTSNSISEHLIQTNMSCMKHLVFSFKQFRLTSTIMPSPRSSANK